MSRAVLVPHVVRGRVVDDATVDQGNGLVTPPLDLGNLAWSRAEPGPLFDVPVDEVVAFLAATGDRLVIDSNPVLRDALDAMAEVSPLDRRVLERCYEQLPSFFDPGWLRTQLAASLPDGALDGWVPVRHPDGTSSRRRAFPVRAVHVLAGNGPGVAAITIARAALTKGVHVLKLPANDPFTATAILRTMIDIDHAHPVVRSFSAVYWKGGDAAVEGPLLRAQFFDKLVVWGGEAAVRHAARFVSPGLELVSFDPKVSISLIGREAFSSPAALVEAARLAAVDAAVLDQDACVASRYQFVEADDELSVDRYAELLVGELGVDRALSSAAGRPTPRDLRDEVEVLGALGGEYRVWGGFDGRGLVVRSPEPLDAHPSAKTVNVVPVNDLADAVRFATPATQTVGVYPPARKRELRDALAAMGVQRVVPLGAAAEERSGLPHDGMYPLQRLVRWVADEVADS